MNTTASASDTGSEWASGSDGQEPDVERTTALIIGEVLFCILSLFTLSLTGPSGSGKTAAVFALAAELGFNVLEVNASSGRNRKHEARSHPEPAGEEGAGEGEGGGGQ